MSLSAASTRVWRRRSGVHHPSGVTLFAGTAVSLLVVLVVGAVAVSSLAGPWADAVVRRVDRIAGLADEAPGVDARSKIYSRNGRLLAILHGEENREPVALAAIPVHVRNAVIAVEDQRFWTHDGVDLTALGRALVVNSSAGEIQQGGGTITMQLARNAYLHDRRRTITRKWDEIVLARSLEHRLTKEQILEAYLNTVYFGRGAYGIQAAAEAFFDKPAAKLRLGEGALLAGFIRAPQEYDPAARRQQALARRTWVLAAMRRLEMIDDAAQKAARKEKVTLASRSLSNGVIMGTNGGAAFVAYVKQQLLADPRLGATQAERTDRLFNGGLKIVTTMDVPQQRAAERAIAQVLDRPNDPSAALAAVEPGTGAIRAMAGIVDAQGFNLAAQGRRQPGSAFKPFTLVAALEQDISLYKGYSGSAPRRIRLDSGEIWRVRNYEGSASGWMNLISATERSVNAVYAQLVMDVGPANVVDAANRMGITSELDPYPSIALGGLTIGVSPLEMASAYATLGAEGVAHATYAVSRVEDRNGRVLVNSPKGKRALDPLVANRTAAVLERVIENGTGRRAQRLGRPAAGKTGTTDDYRDSWFVGFTPQLSTAVWIGHPRARIPLLNIHGFPRLFGGSLPCEIWTRFMIAAHDGKPVVPFPDVVLGTRRFFRSPDQPTSTDEPVQYEPRRRRPPGPKPR